MSERPALSPGMTEAEFLRWYWMRHELVAFARTLGVSTSGDKPTLTARIAAALGGRPGPGTTPRRTVSRRLPEPLTLDTEVPPRQAATRQIRDFLVGHIGPSFRFDVHMRTHLASDDTTTLRDAIEHWHATRHSETPETLPQLELIRFTKAWHLAHPDGSAAQCRAAWRHHRSLPTDQRPTS